MDREAARQEIRRRIPCTDFLQRSKGGLYCCPFCGSGTGPNKTGAVKYYEETNTWNCFACNRSGDAIDLYQETTGADFPAAISLLAQQIGIVIDEEPRPGKVPEKNGQVKPAQRNETGTGNAKTRSTAEAPQNAEKGAIMGTADYTAYYEACKEKIAGPEGATAIAYLKGRGVLTTALYYGAGFDPAADPANAPGAIGEEKKPHPCPRIILPCSKGHYVARRIDGQKGFEKMNPSKKKGAASPAIFNEAALYAQEVQELFVLEGIFDALSVIEAGGQAIALNSADNGQALIRELEERRTAATLILCPDNDQDEKTREKTQAHFNTLAEGLTRLQIPYLMADINNGSKDANEALCKDPYSFREAVEQAQEEAQAQRARAKEAAQQAERERQQRTGAGMIDAFLQTVKTNKYEPVPTGITDIDRAIGGGFIRQQLILLGAEPGAGKTALAQWIFEGMAKRGTTCLYLNLEMSREQILARSISRIAAQNGENIRPTEILQGYRWDFSQEAIVTAAAEEYRQTIAPHMIYNPDGVTADLDSILSYMEDEAQRAEAAGMPAPCVVLDYLQIVTGREREDETAVIKRAVASMKRFAIAHNTFVFLIIAHNRAANKTGDVSLESGRDTSALEYTADLQLGLAYTLCMKKNGGKTKEDLTPEEKRLVTLRVTKARFGGAGTDVDLYFNGETMNYSQTVPGYMDYEGNRPKTTAERMRGRRK